MGLAEEKIEKHRKNIASILKYNGFSLESGNSGEEIYVKDCDQVIFGEKVTYITGSFRDVMPYDVADGVFSSFYHPPPSVLERSQEFLKKSKSHLIPNGFHTDKAA